MSHAQLKLLYVLVRLAEACVASKLGCGVDGAGGAPPRGFEGEQVERSEYFSSHEGIEFLRLRTARCFNSDVSSSW